MQEENATYPEMKAALDEIRAAFKGTHGTT